MAISSAMVFEVRQTGSDSNGGGFRGGAAVSTPSAPAVSGAGTGGTVAANTYYVVVTIVDGNGETPKSAQTSVTTTGTTSTITVTAPTNPNVLGSTWNVYVGTASGGPYFPQGTSLAFGSNRAITATPPTTGTQAPGVDRSQQDAPQVVIDNSTITATTAGANSNVLTFTLGYAPTAADVGNVFHATGGTNIRAGWYEVTAWTATTWTVTGGGNLTTASGAGSAVTGNMGGAFATPGGFGLMDTADGTNLQTCYTKYNATPYSCSSTANVAGGRLATTHGTYLIGYDVTRTRDNVDANRPILDAGSASMTVLSVAGNTSLTRQFSVTNSAARASIVGFAPNGFIESCKADSCATGFNYGSGNTGLVQDCWANACATGFAGGTAPLVRCVATGCTTAGFSNGNNAVVYLGCVAMGGTGSGFISPGFFLNCVSRDNSGAGSSGFQGGNAATIYQGCLSWNNGKYDYDPHPPATSPDVRIWNCAGGGSGSGNFTTVAGLVYGYMVKDFVALTADPHANAAGGDLSLNTASGGGAACRAAGLPATFPGLSTTSYPDIGAAQHSDASVPSTVPAGRIVNIQNIGTY